MIFLKGNVPSSKNGKRWTGKTMIGSKSTLKYKKLYSDEWVEKRLIFKTLLNERNLKKPLLIGFHFVRDSKRKFDFVNPLQTVQDYMVNFDWIEDDNVNEMFPLPININGNFYSYDKENPGVFIEILNMGNELTKSLKHLGVNTEVSYNSIRMQLEDLIDQNKKGSQEAYNYFMEFYTNYLDKTQLN